MLYFPAKPANPAIPANVETGVYYVCIYVQLGIISDGEISL